MRISVDLPDEDVAFLDRYPVSPRSAAIHEAIGLLRRDGPTSDYEHAFADWDASADAELWNNVTADGIES